MYDSYKKETGNIIISMGKNPIFICQDCDLNYTHYDNHMIIVKDSVWKLIAYKEDVLCDHCIEKRLKWRLKISDLWRSEEGNISPINNWFVDYLKQALDEKI